MCNVTQLRQAAIAFLHNILHIGRADEPTLQPQAQVTLMRQYLLTYPFGQRFAFRLPSPLKPRGFTTRFPSTIEADLAGIIAAIAIQMNERPLTPFCRLKAVGL
jgi:hypothetical protein